MHKRLFISVLFTLVLSSSIGQVSFMTFNLRYNNPNDNENRWDNRKADVCTLIEKNHPTYLGIQEGLLSQVKYVDSHLPSYTYVGVGRDDGKTKGEYAAIFYDSTLSKCVEYKTFWLSETPNEVSVGWDASMERIVTYAKFYNLLTQDTFYVFNAHFDHIGKEARVQSARLILSLVEAECVENGRIILMGDLNSTPESEAINVLSQVMQDSFEFRLEDPNMPFETFNGFQKNHDKTKRIDYIFVRNLDVIKYQVISDRRDNGLFISDHFPVVVEVNF